MMIYFFYECGNWQIFVSFFNKKVINSSKNRKTNMTFIYFICFEGAYYMFFIC